MAAVEPSKSMLLDNRRSYGNRLHKRRHRALKNPEWTSRELAWSSLHSNRDKHTFFEHVDIADDGGMSEIGGDELWYRSRYLSSLLTILFVAYNIIYILKTDIPEARQHKANTKTDFLLSKTFFEIIGLQRGASQIIARIEIGILVCLVGKLLFHGVSMVVRKGHHKWLSVARFFWEDLIDLSSFSVIKILQFVTPQQATYDLNFILWYDWSYWRLAWFLISRPIMLCIGLDCFLVKVRDANVYITGHQTPTVECVLGAVILLNQILGVVQINKTIKYRLYRFLFGGEDGCMTDDEKVRLDTWEAMVSERIFQEYPFSQACALMMSWCDDDFQMLALDEKPSN
eukprot:TRINITY_DN28506_c0_g1_i1.p1 TRINITY_DN28506_c0_g1~~TRINITY_DN28506_c0_g1_i1.p1  ORF type:complete len:343 (+),score=59.37 TRINITY_DN28506_c0_g1_i1:81-1109(+)